LFFSMEGKTKECPNGKFTFTSIAEWEAKQGFLPDTRITINNVPIDYALGAIMRMLEIVAPLGERIFLSYYDNMEDIENYSLQAFSGVHTDDIRKGFGYDYVKRPCIHQIYLALRENAHIMIDHLVGYFKGLPTERVSVKGTSDYLTANRMVQYRMIKFGENVEFDWEDVSY